MSWPLVRRSWRALGSHCEMVLALSQGQTLQEAEAALDRAVAWVATAEHRFSRFIATSELCLLNGAAGTWFAASNDLFTLVSEALAWARQTGGLFDPTILPALRQAGYDQDYAAIAQCDLGTLTVDPPPHANYEAVQLDSLRRAIWLPLGTAIDLGGIGKGWMADVLLEQILHAWPDVLVSLGGDLALRGGADVGRGWIVGIQDPRQGEADPPHYLGGVEVCSGGIATSGSSGHWWRRGTVVMHHLIDPRTGQPARVPISDANAGDIIAVTALARTGTAAEVRAKVALLRGQVETLAALDGGQDYAGIAILGDGALQLSANLRQYLAAYGLTTAS